jgi:alanyl-tRNA synthetase
MPSTSSSTSPGPISPEFTGPRLRREFLEYFTGHGHTLVPSASLLPNDATLMFVNAGMVPFKDVFTQKETRAYTRATSSQKCLRVSGKHNDLEEVGRTPRHHTFFEMLGNFSFGDYFKEEAIQRAWHLLTDVWAIDKSKLWITVHTSDDETFELWTKKMNVPAERVQRLGDKDNFWTMGETGPCGPCTEIHYDMGPLMGDDTRGPAGESDRYMEIWNLVFMQYERFADGTQQDLPRPSVDTGMGLERVACVKQGKINNYDTDLLYDLVLAGAKAAGVDPRADAETLTGLRVMADHARACAFLVAEGVIPGNEGRGYVLRRIARRAIRFGVKLGLGETPFFHNLTQTVVEGFGEAFPELQEREGFIREVIRGEEERFAETRDRGLALLDKELERLAEGGTLDGEVVFKLHDTYGFPSDLTALIASERNLSVDNAGFKAHMAEQQAMGRKAWKGSGTAGTDKLWLDLAAEVGGTDFTGYDSLDGESTVVALVQDSARVQSLGEGGGSAEGIVITASTPFYGESGGQMGDTGEIQAGEARATVTDTRKPGGDLVAHHVTVGSGTLTVGDTVQLSVGGAPRKAGQRNHTATHLLQSALRQVLGNHVAQKGSLVGPDRLRFDFSHHKSMSPEELHATEALVYEQILANTAVANEILPVDEAKSRGATAMFGEKYGDEVRVITVGDFSMELCGGTHVNRTGDIGLFRIVSEGGVAAGVRRIEAQTGHGALAVVRDEHALIAKTTEALRIPAAELPAAVAKLQEDNRALRKELDDERKKAALAAAGDMLSDARDIGGFKVLAAESEDVKGMREQADKLRDQLGSGVVVLGARPGGKKAILLVAITSDLAGKRLHAGKLVGQLAAMVGGRGGGRPDFAQAGGPNAAGVPAALEAAYEVVAAAIA